MKIIQTETALEASMKLAEILLEQVKENPKSVLGLATGSSPELAYAHLVKLSKESQLDWKYIQSFNLDEYEQIDEQNKQSYHYFMNHHLFDHVSILKENTHFPSDTPFNEETGIYDHAIEKAGGIDLQVLGIGTNAHIAFNEPGTSFDSKTRLVDLAPTTIEDNSRFFSSIHEVPKRAYSSGIQTIMKAKKIVLIATSAAKAWAVKAMLEDTISENVPATILRTHPFVTIIVDKDAAGLLE